MTSSVFNSGYSNNYYLRTSDTVNLHSTGGFDTGDTTGDDRTRSVTVENLYIDVLRFVSANIDLDLKVVNVPSAPGDAGGLSILDDRKTFQMAAPGIPAEYEDNSVIITTDDIKDGLGIPNQQLYNEYTLAELNWHKAWAERFDTEAIYDSPAHDPIDDSAVLNNIRVTAGFVSGNPKAPAINMADGIMFLDTIGYVDGRVDQLVAELKALYEASRVGRYIIHLTQDAFTVPGPGEVTLMTAADTNFVDGVTKWEDITLLNVHQLSYAADEPEVDTGDSSIVPILINNYMVHNQPGKLLNFQGQIYEIDYDENRADPEGIKEIYVDADNTYYEIKVKASQVSDAVIVDPPYTGDVVETVGVFCFKSDADAEALLTNYMKKSGLDDGGVQDQFTGEIKFNSGIQISHGQLNFTGISPAIEVGGNKYISFDTSTGDTVIDSGVVGGNLKLGRTTDAVNIFMTGQDSDRYHERGRTIIASHGKKGWLAAEAAAAGSVSDVMGWDSDGVAISKPVDMMTQKITNMGDPVDDQDAVTLKYFENNSAGAGDYVSKTGDTMTGTLRFKNSSDVEKVTIQTDGKIQSAGIIKSIRDSGTSKAFEVKPADTDTTNWYVQTDGKMYCQNYSYFNHNVDIDTSGTGNTQGVRIKGELRIKKKGSTITGTNIFEVNGEYGRYIGQQSHNDDLATVKYVKDNAGGGFSPGDTVAATSSGGASKYGFYYDSGRLYFKLK